MNKSEQQSANRIIPFEKHRNFAQSQIVIHTIHLSKVQCGALFVDSILIAIQIDFHRMQCLELYYQLE